MSSDVEDLFSGKDRDFAASFDAVTSPEPGFMGSRDIGTR
jgi:hypothetical protein